MSTLIVRITDMQTLSDSLIEISYSISATNGAAVISDAKTQQFTISYTSAELNALIIADAVTLAAANNVVLTAPDRKLILGGFV